MTLSLLDQFIEIALEGDFGFDVGPTQVRFEPLDERLDVMFDHFSAEGFFALEIVIEGALRHADALHQLLQPSAVVALLHQEGNSTVQELRSQLFYVASAHGVMI